MHFQATCGSSAVCGHSRKIQGHFPCLLTHSNHVTTSIHSAKKHLPKVWGAMAPLAPPGYATACTFENLGRTLVLCSVWIKSLHCLSLLVIKLKWKHRPHFRCNLITSILLKSSSHERWRYLSDFHKSSYFLPWATESLLTVIWISMVESDSWVIQLQPVTLELGTQLEKKLNY